MNDINTFIETIYTYYNKQKLNVVKLDICKFKGETYKSNWAWKNN